MRARVLCVIWDGTVYLIPTRIVRCALITLRAGRCNLISAGWGGRLAAGWRFNRISICLVAASQYRRRCTVVSPTPTPLPPLPPPPLSLLLLLFETRSAHTAYRMHQALRKQPWTSIFLGHSNSRLCRAFWCAQWAHVMQNVTRSGHSSKYFLRFVIYIQRRAQRYVTEG